MTKFGKALLVAASLCLAGGVAEAQTKLSIASTNKGVVDNIVLWSGQQSGIFKKHGLEVEIVHFRGGGEVVRGVVSGTQQLGLVATSAAIIANVKGEPLKIISGLSQPMYGVVFIVTPDSPIKTVKDLNGKKVGVSLPGSIVHTAILQVAEKEKIKVDMVTVADLGDSIAALKAGRVDASWYAAPSVFALTQKKEARLLFESSEYIKEFQQNAFVGMTPWMDKNKATVKAFLAAMAETVDWMKANHAQTIKIAAKEMDLPEAVVDEAFARMPKGYFTVAAPTQPNMKGAIDGAIVTGAFKEPPPYESLVDLQYLPKK
jgi:NitT/TauT family transport system substrate-binding protein